MKTLLMLAFAFGAAAAAPGAQDALTAAKDLYASAAYEDALSALAGFDGSTAAPNISRQVDQYRAFCLYALGRTKEAESVAESLIRKNPLMQLDLGEASPRIQAMFTGARKRLLPGLIRERYRTAKIWLDRRDYVGAEPHLTEIHQMLADAQASGAWDDGLGDLRVLVEGFLDLARAKADQAARVLAGQAKASSDVQVKASSDAQAKASPDASAAVGPASTKAEPPAVESAKAPEASGTADEYLVPPVTIRQDMPSAPPQLAAIMNSTRRSGVLEVIIDERGAVEQAVIRNSLNPTYDELLIDAARHWRYRPATKNGTPVRYTKTIIITSVEKN